MTKQSTIAAAPAAAKEDLYYAVHKGIRFASAKLLIRIGATDPDDDQEVLETLGAVDAHLTMSLSHLTHENHTIHTAIEGRVPGGSDHAAEDHDHHLQSFEELRALVQEVAKAKVGRAAALRRLYQRFALFVADDLSHMHEEETELMPLIQAHFGADEIVGIRERIVGAIPPDEMALFTRAMLGAATRPERVATVTGMSAGMPPEVFAGFMASVVGRPWTMGDWDALERAVC